MKHRRPLFILTACILFVCWVIFSPFLATNLLVEHRLERAEVILVLSGSAAYKERNALAAELFAQGVSPKVLISDDGGRAGWAQAEQANLPFVELARRELIHHGVPLEAIIQVPGRVTGTESEARRFAEAAEDGQIRSVLIVTSPYHTRRAYKTFSKVLAGKDINIGIVSPPIGRHSPEPGLWWLSTAGLKNVAGEYVKTLGYWVFYW